MSDQEKNGDATANGKEENPQEEDDEREEMDEREDDAVSQASSAVSERSISGYDAPPDREGKEEPEESSDAA